MSSGVPSSWSQTIRERLPSSTRSALRREWVIQKAIVPTAKLILAGAFFAFIFAVAISLSSFGGEWNAAQQAMVGTGFVIWFGVNAWRLAAEWLRIARFSERSRTCFFLPDKSRFAWLTTGRALRGNFATLAVECLVISWILLEFNDHYSVAFSRVLLLAVGTWMTTIGWIGWFLFLSAFRRRFDLWITPPRPLGKLLPIALFILIGFAGTLQGDAWAANYEQAWSLVRQAPGLGILIDLALSPEPMGPKLFTVQNLILLGAVVVLPWSFTPWIARRFQRFVDRHAPPLLALHWPRQTGNVEIQSPVSSSSSPGQPTAADSNQEAASRKNVRAALPFAWPLKAPRIPRWAVIDWLLPKLLSPREQQLYRAITASENAVLSLAWFRGAGLLLIATIIAKAQGFADPIWFVAALLGQVFLVTLAYRNLIGGFPRNFWGQAAGPPNASFPLFAGLPVTLRDLVMTDWKTYALRTVVSLPWFFTWLEALPLTNPRSKSLAVLFGITVLIGGMALRPTRLPGVLHRRTLGTGIGSLVTWWQFLAGISLAASVILAPFAGLWLSARQDSSWSLPLIAFGLLLPAYLFWIIHWTFHNRGETTLEFKPPT